MRKDIKAAFLAPLALLAAACGQQDGKSLQMTDESASEADSKGPKHDKGLVRFECDVKSADGREIEGAPESQLSLNVHVPTEASLSRNETDAEFTKRIDEKVDRYIKSCEAEMTGQTDAMAENQAAFDAQAAQAGTDALTDHRGTLVAKPASPTISFAYTVKGQAPVTLTATDVAAAQKHSVTVRTAIGISR